MAWIFLMNSVLYLWNSLQWIRFLSTQRPAFPAYSGVPGGLIFSAVVAGVLLQRTSDSDKHTDYTSVLT